MSTTPKKLIQYPIRRKKKIVKPKATFMDLPTDVLLKITEDFDWKTRISLRKVCQPLRDFIDNNPHHPIQFFNHIQILIERNAIDFYVDGNLVHYRRFSASECLVGYKMEPRKLSGNVLDIFITDLKSILSHGKLHLRHLDVELNSASNYKKFWREFQKFKLPIDYFSLKVKGNHQMTQMLTWLNRDVIAKKMSKTHVIQKGIIILNDRTRETSQKIEMFRQKETKNGKLDDFDIQEQVLRPLEMEKDVFKGAEMVVKRHGKNVRRPMEKPPDATKRPWNPYFARHHEQK